MDERRAQQRLAHAGHPQQGCHGREVRQLPVCARLPALQRTPHLRAWMAFAAVRPGHIYTSMLLLPEGLQAGAHLAADGGNRDAQAPAEGCHDLVDVGVVLLLQALQLQRGTDAHPVRYTAVFSGSIHGSSTFGGVRGPACCARWAWQAGSRKLGQARASRPTATRPLPASSAGQSSRPRMPATMPGSSCCIYITHHRVLPCCMHVQLAMGGSMTLQGHLESRRGIGCRGGVSQQHEEDICCCRLHGLPRRSAQPGHDLRCGHAVLDQCCLTRSPMQESSRSVSLLLATTAS